MDKVATARNGRRFKMVVRSVLVTAAVAVGLFVLPTPVSSTNPNCTMELHTANVNGEDVYLQDQSAPGRDDCDGDTTDKHRRFTRGGKTLGFDCKLRSPDNVVVATTTPNRADGTCGQPER